MDNIQEQQLRMNELLLIMYNCYKHYCNCLNTRVNYSGLQVVGTFRDYVI